MEFINYQTEQGKVLINGVKEKILFSAIQAGTVRIQITKEQEFSQKQSYSVVNRNASSQFTVIESDTTLAVKTPALCIMIDKQNFDLSYYNNNGGLLTKEPKGRGRSLTSFELEKTVFDENSEVKVSQNADGVRADANVPA